MDMEGSALSEGPRRQDCVLCRECPAKGYKSYLVSPAPIPIPTPRLYSAAANNLRFFNIEFDDDEHSGSDRRTGRLVAPRAKAQQLIAYEDRPSTTTHGMSSAISRRRLRNQRCPNASNESDVRAVLMIVRRFKSSPSLNLRFTRTLTE